MPIHSLAAISIIFGALIAWSLQTAGASAGITATASLASMFGLYGFSSWYVMSWNNRKFSSRILPKIFHPVQKFWISAKGNYVLNTVFGRNSNKTVFWDISPAEEAKTDAHIAATPDVNRNFGSA